MEKTLESTPDIPRETVIELQRGKRISLQSGERATTSHTRVVEFPGGALVHVKVNALERRDGSTERRVVLLTYPISGLGQQAIAADITGPCVWQHFDAYYGGTLRIEGADLFDIEVASDDPQLFKKAPEDLQAQYRRRAAAALGSYDD